MEELEELVQNIARALMRGARRGVAQAARGQKKGVAYRFGTQAILRGEGGLVAEKDKQGNLTGTIGVKVLDMSQLVGPGTPGELGADVGGGWGFRRTSGFTGTSGVEVGVYVELANAAALEEGADADIDPLDRPGTEVTPLPR